MKEQYKIIDNFLDKVSFKHIKDFVLAETFRWFLSKKIANKNEKDRDNALYFYHLIYKDNAPYSNIMKLIHPIIKKLDVKALIRIKINLYPNQDKFIIHTPHTDYPYKHKGAIFYINTNNGYTLLENKIKIKSVANRLLLFNPSKKHSSTSCTDKRRRVNINFNFF